MTDRAYLEDQLAELGLPAELLARLSIPQLRRVYEEALTEIDEAKAAGRPRDLAPLVARWSIDDAPPGMWFCRGGRCSGLAYPASRSVPHPVTCLDAAWTWPGPTSLPRHDDEGPPPTESLADRLLLQAERRQTLDDLANRVEDKLQAVAPNLSGLISGVMTAARLLVGLPPSRLAWDILRQDDERRQLLQVLDVRIRQLGGSVDRDRQILERRQRLEILVRRAITPRAVLFRLFERDHERRRLLQLLTARAAHP